MIFGVIHFSTKDTKIDIIMTPTSKLHEDALCPQGLLGLTTPQRAMTLYTRMHAIEDLVQENYTFLLLLLLLVFPKKLWKVKHFNYYFSQEIKASHLIRKKRKELQQIPMSIWNDQ